MQFYSKNWRDWKKLQVEMFILVFVDVHNFVSVTLRVYILTMSEKTWLHWSVSLIRRGQHLVGPYHVWKDMAPLKRHLRCRHLRKHRLLPCLKRHGSIEAQSWVYHLWAGYSLPCLKRHGSIEALRTPGHRQMEKPLTMSEKTWLHWSTTG